MQAFAGFSTQCMPFLRELALNNNKAWFNENKDRYERFVREPALLFIEAMAERLPEISPRFRAVAKKSGGSLMRVYRDTRFSKDKTPYKTNIGIQFRHELGKDVHAPGFYVHVEPENCFLGAGIWHPDPKTLGRIRDFIVDNPSAWKSARGEKGLGPDFPLVGESLQRPPRGYPAGHELIADLKRKDFIACRDFDCAEISRGSLPEFVTNGYRQADALMRYLCEAVDVDY